MQNHTLEEFSINGLNDDSTVNLKFTDNLKVIVSENGYGKTTIISILYYFLKKDKKLKKFNFESLSIKFNGKANVVYPKSIAGLLFEDDFVNSLQYIAKIFDDNKIADKNSRKINLKTLNSFYITLMIFFMVNSDSESKISGAEISKISVDLGIAEESVLSVVNIIKKFVGDYDYMYNFEDVNVQFSELYHGVDEIYNDVYKGHETKFSLQPFVIRLQFLLDNINELGNKEFIYLPTYRLVESSISSFRKNENDNFYFDNSDQAQEFFRESTLIQFGVQDIKDIWSEISDRIRRMTTQDFLKLSGTLLKNILDNKKIDGENIEELLCNKESILKILSRIDQGTIDKKSKRNLLNILEKKEFNLEYNNNALFYILENMVAIYNNQKHLDVTINKYKNAVNEFLKNKKVIYNEITSEIYVEKVIGRKRIDIENLSSGEKQILSLFTKIYLSEVDDIERKYWIFFDEPEISLSIEWQQILIPTILESKRCEFLLAATHSPFIFKNYLKSYTSDLSLEVTEFIK
ncbi:AAA family ATPase [Pantoea stewartii]|uniref:AAA family ATPase n=1 Tax=Pantoea stewartii TaxID=66269 RepID=UPI0006CFE3FF|nr:AAA family ATPase [Pantoea stewartii]